MATSDIHYLGIRHHGPGSARRVIAALDQLDPQQVLIEGPADCSDLLPLLAHQQLKPPVALLAYAAAEPNISLYYPFAEFSPEYQACLWAIKHNKPVHFIDLPVSIQLAQQLQRLEQQQKEDGESDDEVTTGDEPLEEAAAPLTDEANPLARFSLDPIGALAELAGYEDGESWWNDLIEQNADSSLQLFATVESAMASLREKFTGDTESDITREAHMRLEISKAAKDVGGNLAVVCGAWHVPALKEKQTAKADRELLKTLPTKLSKSKIKATWIPWTSPRLAMISGYGAGVSAPMWYQHLWQNQQGQHALEHWLGKVARTLREAGHMVSTASVIEAVRLSSSLAAVRNRPAPGFEEIREAIVACLCFGEAIIWRDIEARLLLGNQVGSIPDDAPLVPLLEDLQRWQKKLKLKPEALEREVALDLRAPAGLGKSVLLHRLAVLDVPWGYPQDAGGSRGTFRERWVLKWEPEYAVKLVENLVYGSTIEQAANNKLTEALHHESHLNRLAETVQLCLEAQLNQAADKGLLRLDERAAHTDDALELLRSLPPLIDTQRYGTAREMSLGHVDSLINRLAVQSALALPYACRNLNDEEALQYRISVNATHKALQLAELDSTMMSEWWDALKQVTDSHLSSYPLVGLCARLLYQAKKISPDELQILLQKALSPAIAAANGARFFEGFFSDAVQQLLYDSLLLESLETWLIHLEEDTFVEFLPLFRRVFSALDAMERKRLLDRILAGRAQLQSHKTLNPQLLPLWPEHLQRIGKLLQRDNPWTT